MTIHTVTIDPQPVPRARAADHDGHRHTVAADDGTPLSVRDHGPADAPLTVVFVHGHCLRGESWAFLHPHLRQHCGGRVRVVTYDHRGHGASGTADATTYTIDQLGHDLDAVLRAIVPTGPIVLVGHSMGAMVLLSYARQFPAMIGTRVIGAGFIAGTSGRLTTMGLARYLNRHTVGSLRLAVRRAPRLMYASKRLSRRLLTPIVREAALGTRRVGPRVVAVATAMINETRLETMAGFLDSLIHFDETATLPQLADLPTLVLSGSADLLVPFTHSALLAAQLRHTELVRVDGAGHSVILERAAEVGVAVAALTERALHAFAGAPPQRPAPELAGAVAG
ncbi:alpha/beta fold hydrolase [Nocardia stercoris]|uniref:Alpha/beta hydrolase n=1 Tax=Nocardia stercoris TaxID=2483361 RepID=A0A3M2LEL2_9NOCA|nr:alpha/beta hydrolase [Nocardia stercoris]RMI34415.1 alpha/beta hydrolase [Nocardia stercoris]